MRILCAIVVGITVLAVSGLEAATIYVPDNFATIQAAISAASTGDTILVRPGYYPDRIDFLGKGLMLKSTDGAESTILEAHGVADGQIILINGVQNGADTAIVDGFTLSNSNFRAMRILDSRAIVRNNIVSGCDDNFATAAGGAISAMANPYLLIQDNDIVNNHATLRGGGIWVHSSTVYIKDNYILGNTTDGNPAGGIHADLSTGSITGNTIIGNFNGGVFLDDSPLIVSGNIIAQNSGRGLYFDVSSEACAYNNSIVYNSGIGFEYYSSAPPHQSLLNSIVWGNGSQAISNHSVSYCDIQGSWTGPGTGNIDDDPIFCSVSDTNFHIHETSPCVGTGEGDANMGALGIGCGDQIISGMIFYDVNNNGSYEPELADEGIPNRKVIDEALGIAEFTDDSGYYIFNAPSGNHTIKQEIGLCRVQTFPIAPTEYSFTLNPGEDKSELDFGIAEECDTVAYQFWITHTRLRPGREVNYFYTVKNIGTVPLESLTVTIETPEIFQFPDLETGNFCENRNDDLCPDGFLRFETIIELDPAETGAEEGVVTTCVLGTTNTNLPCGARICWTTCLRLFDGENFQIACRVDCYDVVCALDPNEMSVHPSGAITEDDYLSYHIDFQNVGNDTAFQVVIVDTIDQNLDLTTLEFIESRHDCDYLITADREVKFIFSDIQLPDSTENEIGSQGFVEFRIRPMTGLPLGTEIHNRAGITFDFMPPVITNEVVNIVGCCDTAGDANSDSTINVGDAVFLINYIFRSGPAPTCADEGNANCDDDANIGDAVYLINFIFRGGPEPCCP